MMTEDALIIEFGEEYIRNGRKLMKEDFEINFNKNMYKVDNKDEKDKTRSLKESTSQRIHWDFSESTSKAN